MQQELNKNSDLQPLVCPENNEMNSILHSETQSKMNIKNELNIEQIEIPNKIEENINHNDNNIEINKLNQQEIFSNEITQENMRSNRKRKFEELNSPIEQQFENQNRYKNYKFYQSRKYMSNEIYPNFPNYDNGQERLYHTNKYIPEKRPLKTKGGYSIFINGLPSNVFITTEEITDILNVEKFNEELQNHNNDKDYTHQNQRSFSSHKPHNIDCSILNRCHIEISKIELFQSSLSALSMGAAILKVKVKLQEAQESHERNFLYLKENEFILHRFISFINSIQFDLHGKNGNLEADFALLQPPNTFTRKY